jgi:UDP-2-acetamido-2-deoxy-ribo-hexuluronate aminotransferase
LFGLPADYGQIEKFAEEYSLFILEDAAQGLGGAIFTDDDALAEKMTSIRVHGSGSDKYDNVRLGLNGRLDTLQAAILLEKLVIFKEEIMKHNETAEYYTSKLSNHYETPDIPDGYISAWAQYSILARSSADRGSAIEHLKSHDIPAIIYYKISLHLQGVFSALGYTQGDFPVSEESSKKTFSIPMHPNLDRNQQDVIIEMLNSCG